MYSILYLTTVWQYFCKSQPSSGEDGALEGRVERRQWLPSGSCLKLCPVGNVFNSISYDRMTVLLQITAKYRRRRSIRGQSRKKAVVAIWELPYWPAAHHAPTLTWILHIYINAGLHVPNVKRTQTQIQIQTLPHWHGSFTHLTSPKIGPSRCARNTL